MESIDVFCHILPRDYGRLVAHVGGEVPWMLSRALEMPVLVDLDARFAVMDEFPGYRQVLSLASPPLEVLAPPAGAAELARRVNDALAKLVAEHPDRFAGFVASLALGSPDEARRESRRAVRELGACGVQLFTSVAGRPLDRPEYLAIFEDLAALDRPVWLHPTRGLDVPDYPGEPFSRYELWWALGWPYETSLAMARLVFAGLFDRCPRLAVITHHVGGMIPMMEGRLANGLAKPGGRVPPRFAASVETPLRESPVAAMRRFYADTASFGSRAAIACGMEFFGIERMIFATDMPFDPEHGPGFIRDTLRAINELPVSDADKAAMLAGNARRLLKLR